MDPGSKAYREDVEVRHTGKTIKEAKTMQDLDPGSKAYREDDEVRHTGKTEKGQLGFRASDNDAESAGKTSGAS